MNKLSFRNFNVCAILLLVILIATSAFVKQNEKKKPLSLNVDYFVEARDQFHSVISE